MRAIKVACILTVLGLFVGCSCPKGDCTREKQVRLARARHAMDRDERSNGEGRCGGLIMAELSDKTPRVGTDSMPPTQTFLKESGRTGANGQGVGFPQ